MSNMEGQTVAKILVEEVFCETWSAENTSFRSGYCSKNFVLHIEKKRTSPYHPQSDGMVERFNKTLASHHA